MLEMRDADWLMKRGQLTFQLSALHYDPKKTSPTKGIDRRGNLTGHAYRRGHSNLYGVRNGAKKVE